MLTVDALQVRVSDMSSLCETNKDSLSLFETDMVKLNMAILSVCIFNGAMRGDNEAMLGSLALRRPFANLLLFSRRVLVEPQLTAGEEQSEKDKVSGW
jgi:hypothetical protein